MADEVAVLAGGCFWCTEAVYLDVEGVKSVTSGYTGGRTSSPTYKQVCAGDTGHAEAVQIIFDPHVISYHELLDIFFAVHNPTELNRQGGDIGTQYRSGIYVYNDAQRQAAEAARASYEQSLNAAGYRPITTEILDAPEFYFAEDYHQQYLAKNPRGYCGLGGTGVSCQIGTGIAAA